MSESDGSAKRFWDWLERLNAIHNELELLRGGDPPTVEDIMRWQNELRLGLPDMIDLRQGYHDVEEFYQDDDFYEEAKGERGDE